MSTPDIGNLIPPQNRERTGRAVAVSQRIKNSPDGLSHTRFDSLITDLHDSVHSTYKQGRRETQDEQRRRNNLYSNMLDLFGELGTWDVIRAYEDHPTRRKVQAPTAE